MAESTANGRFSDPKHRFIAYRLNILGIRVREQQCQLVAKNARGEWTPLGPSRPLPVVLPANASDIGSDALLLTAYQFDTERPGSDIRAVLAQSLPFEEALRTRGDCATPASTT